MVDYYQEFRYTVSSSGGIWSRSCGPYGVWVSVGAWVRGCMGLWVHGYMVLPGYGGPKVMNWVVGLVMGLRSRTGKGG